MNRQNKNFLLVAFISSFGVIKPDYYNQGEFQSIHPKGSLMYNLEYAAEKHPALLYVMGKLVGSCIEISAGIGKAYIKKFLFAPLLCAKQQSSTLFARYINYLWPNKPLPTLHDCMIIHKNLEDQCNLLIGMTKNIKKHGGSYDNALLYGAPGTGKTMFAEYLAQACGMAYALIPASNISQFLTGGKAVEELNYLFAWAAAQPTGTILFFDEAEIFLGDRKRLDVEAQQALNAFLAKTGTPSNTIMIVCATNRPECLDAAVLSRFGIRMEFPLPDHAGRKAQFDMQIKATFGNQKMGSFVEYSCLQDETYKHELAEKLEGCSGRAIQQFVNRLRQQALAENSLTLEKNLIERVLKYTMDDVKT